MSGPNDKWTAVPLQSPVTSTEVLGILNAANTTYTAAFVFQASDGLYLFLGSYPDTQ